MVDLDADGWAVVKYVNVGNGYDVYVVKNAALAGKTDAAIDAATIFSKIRIPKEWNNNEMAAMNNASLNIVAYATQTVGVGFENAVSALKTAFPEWADLNP